MYLPGNPLSIEEIPHESATLVREAGVPPRPGRLRGFSHCRVRKHDTDHGDDDLCAAAVTAQFVGSEAARDALFLTSLDFTALPAMLIATSVCSLLLVAANGRSSAGCARHPGAGLLW